MSTIKNPIQKKSMSLKRDRRNTYGENSKSSRKNIARGKQRRHMDERRATSQLLRQITGHVDEEVTSQAEHQIKLTIFDSRNRGFRKIPDRPLGEVLARKRVRKKLAGNSGAPPNGTV